MINYQSHNVHIGLLAAMPEELGLILENLEEKKINIYGDLELVSGIWKNSNNKIIFITVGWSGWGKVSASRAATRLISSTYKGKNVDLILFTGVAGAANKNLKQWDIVISDSVIQHDMDARPLFEKFHIPVFNQKLLKPDEKLLNQIFKSLLYKKDKGDLKNFGNVFKGLIATGDRFISDKNELDKLNNDIPELLAIEMEGAAFAQVAKQEKIDWIILRVISDSADDSATNDFNTFLRDYKTFSWDLIKACLAIF